MKKYLTHLILLFLLLIPFSVRAEIDPDAYECDLDEIAREEMSWSYLECPILHIRSTNNLDYLDIGGWGYKYFDEVNFYNVVIDDFYFLEGFNEVKKISFHDSKVNLTTMPIVGKSYYFYSSKVVNDDFSKFKGHSLVDFSMVGGYIKDPTTLKYISVTNSFTFANNKYIFMDFSDFYPFEAEGYDWFFDGLSHNFDQDFVDHLQRTPIGSQTIDYFRGPFTMELFNNAYDSMELEGKSEIEQIKTISLYVVDNLNDDEPEPYFDHLRAGLTGLGNNYHYSFLTAAFLQKAGFTAFVVNEDPNPRNEGFKNSWVEILYEGEWYGINPYKIETLNLVDKVKNGENVEYFMKSVDSDEFANNHDASSKVDEFIEYSFEITFVNDGELIYETLPVDVGSYVLPVPNKKDYVFDGWYSDLLYTQKIESASDIKKNGNLYAKWVTEEEANKGTNPGGGTIPNPGTGSFIILSIVILCLILTGIVIINNKVFRRVFKI